MSVHKVTISLTTQTEELPNGKEKVAIKQTEEDENYKFVFFSRSTNIIDIKKKNS